MREGSLSGPGRFRIRSHGGSSHLGSSRMLLQSRRMLRDEEVCSSLCRSGSAQAILDQGVLQPLVQLRMAKTFGQQGQVSSTRRWSAKTFRSRFGARAVFRAREFLFYYKWPPARRYSQDVDLRLEVRQILREIRADRVLDTVAVAGPICG